MASSKPGTYTRGGSPHWPSSPHGFLCFHGLLQAVFFLRLNMSYLLHEYLMTGLERGLNMIRTLATLQKDTVSILHGNPQLSITSVSGYIGSLPWASTFTSLTYCIETNIQTKLRYP